MMSRGKEKYVKNFSGFKPAVDASSFKGRGWKAKGRGSKFKFFSRPRAQDSSRFRRHFPRDREEGSPRFHFQGAGESNQGFQKQTNKKFFFFKYKRPASANKLTLKPFALGAYRLLKNNAGLDKKLGMTNYWKIFKKNLEPSFNFSYTQADNDFYLGVIRSYMHVIKSFIKTYLLRLHFRAGTALSSDQILSSYYGAYKVQNYINYLAVFYEKALKTPDYYFRGYRSALKFYFYRYLAIFCTKIFILTNKIFSVKLSRIENHSTFFHLWKRIYKKWLNVYYEKPTHRHKTARIDSRARAAIVAVAQNGFRYNFKYWRDLFHFSRDWAGYRRFLLRYLYNYAESNYGTDDPFTYRKKKYRFKYNIFGQRIYLIRKPLFRRKSRKYIRWFRTLVTGGYYFSPSYAKRTFFRGGYGRKAWMTKRRARHVFKMKFVFVRYFSKRFNLKNRTAFLRKAQQIARKRGNKWLRYYKEFESRLLRVLVLFGLSSNDDMAKNFISNNWVLVNRKILNDQDYKKIPRVRMGDLVSLSNSAAPYFLKKKFNFFKKYLSFYDRIDQAKFVYSFFKKYFLEWMVPSVYSINGPIIKHGLTALMSGLVVKNSKVYFRISKFIPFFNRTLFKIFVQRFSKKLN